MDTHVRKRQHPEFAGSGELSRADFSAVVGNSQGILQQFAPLTPKRAFHSTAFDVQIADEALEKIGMDAE